VSCRNPKYAEFELADTSLAFEYGASVTGASVDECETVLQCQSPGWSLTLSSEDDSLAPPVVPTRRSPEADT